MGVPLDKAEFRNFVYAIHIYMTKLCIYTQVPWVKRGFDSINETSYIAAPNTPYLTQEICKYFLPQV